MDKLNIQQAANVISDGGVIAYPTEAVWGLGCNPWNEVAVKKLLQIKRRDSGKGLVIVASSITQLNNLCADLPQQQLQQLRHTWPGPCNWIIPDKKSWLPSFVRGKHASVAVRVSAHTTIQKLCSAVGHPLISTSANIAGEPPCLTCQQVHAIFSDKISGIVDGDLGGKTNPCVIRDLSTSKIIRMD